jgi:hypothetical protein
MGAFRDSATNRTPKNRARQSAGCALGIVTLFILFWPSQKTSAQPVALAPDEINGLRVRIQHCWKPPAGVTAATQVHVDLDIRLKSDGSLAGDPVVVERVPQDVTPALESSAIEAVKACQPFTMLKPEHYDSWKELILSFDPAELLGR